MDLRTSHVVKLRDRLLAEGTLAPQSVAELASGVSDAVAIKLMGHADSKILRRYQEVVDELQRDAATRMDRLLGG
jgi:hypothetical protein